jgi:signal transduction histidine kinase
MPDERGRGWWRRAGDGRDATATSLRPFAASPGVVDLALCVVVLVLPLVVIALDPQGTGEGVDGAQAVSAAIGAPLLLLRRRYPVLVLAVGVLASVVIMAVSQEPPLLLPVVLITLYTMSAGSSRLTAGAAGVAVAVTLYGATVVFLDESFFSAPALATLAWSGLATAAGDAVRSRRAYVAAVEERARRAEETREEEARRRVAEERLRIARDLHDVVAHRMTVISVQAAVATHFLRSQPDDADVALAAVRDSAAAVLDELGGMLDVLRGGEDAEEPVEPTPTLRELPLLVESFAAAGLHVDWHSSGAPRRVPDAVQVTAYRVVQEGLTNAHRHGDGRARLEVASTPSELMVRIDNRFPDHPRSTTDSGLGFGLVGMRERVIASGGTLEAGATADGCFRVVAHLPIVPTEGS